VNLAREPVVLRLPARVALPRLARHARRGRLFSSLVLGLPPRTSRPGVSLAAFGVALRLLELELLEGL
jgi:hypothetical protein